MKTASLTLVAATFCFFLAGSLSAQLVTLSQPNRYVNTYSSAGFSNGSVVDSHLETSTDFTLFNRSATSSALWPDPDNSNFQSQSSANAQQTSSFSATGFSITQGITYATGTPLPGGGIVDAIAESLFQVTLTVTQAISFTVKAQIDRMPPLGRYTEHFTLHSANTNQDFSSSLGNFTGTLLPGETYVFTASQKWDDAIPDPMGRSGYADSTIAMTFVTVPEPSASLLLVSGLLFVIGMHRRSAQFRRRGN